MFEASDGRLKVLHCNTGGEHFQQLFRGSATATKFLIDLHAVAIGERITEAGGNPHMTNVVMCTCGLLWLGPTDLAD